MPMLHFFRSGALFSRSPIELEEVSSRAGARHGLHMGMLTALAEDCAKPDSMQAHKDGSGRQASSVN